MKTSFPPSRSSCSPSAESRRRRRHPRLRTSTAAAAAASLLGCLLMLASTAHGESSPGIPRSTNRYSSPNSVDVISSPSSNTSSDDDIPTVHSPQPPIHPPWNPSPKIHPNGFLTTPSLYPRLPGDWEPLANLRGKYAPSSTSPANALSLLPVRIRQVPGDGNCLFHSIAASLHRLVHGKHIDMSTPESIRRLRRRSLELRNRAVDVLEKQPRRRLFLQGDEYLEARELLAAAAAQFELGGEEYCDLMRRESYWGGGPEIVALCNYLQRPIHIYELIPTSSIAIDDNHHNLQQPQPQPQPQQQSPTNTKPQTIIRNNKISPKPLPTSTQFTLRRMACFGSPKYDRREPLHILSADSRFPDVDPRKIRRVGNHFLALFPLTMKELRDGIVSDVDVEIDLDDDGNAVRANGAGMIRGGKNGMRLSLSLWKNNGSDDDAGGRRRKHALVRGGCGKKRKRFFGGDAKTDDGGVQLGDEFASNRKNGDQKIVNDRWEGGIGKWTNQMVDWIASGGDDGGHCHRDDDDDDDDSSLLRTFDGSTHDRGGRVNHFFKLSRRNWEACRQLGSLLRPYMRWVLINVVTLMSVSELR
ncbi:hypothetical protein ACHAXS_011822 [Conticribra weissflogii]